MSAKVHDPITPGEILLTEFLEPLEISQYRLAQTTGLPQTRISEIVHGQAPDHARHRPEALPGPRAVGTVLAWPPKSVGRDAALDPQYVGVGVSAAQAGCAGVARCPVTCGSSGRVRSVWSPNGPGTCCVTVAGPTAAVPPGG